MAPAMTVEIYERDIQAAIRIALGLCPDVLLWRNAAGVTAHEGRVSRFGLALGAADLLGMLTVDGVGIFLAIEVKRPGGKLSEHQNRWRALVERRGGIYILAHSAVEAVDGVEAARLRYRLRMDGFQL